MAKKARKKMVARKIKLSATEKAQRFAARYGVELDESNVASVKAVLNTSAKGKYKNKLSGEDLGLAYVTQRTPAEFRRDLEVARQLTGQDISESEFINNINDYDAMIQNQIASLTENSGLSGYALAHLISTQVFGSPD